MPNDIFHLAGTTIDGRYRVDEAIGEGGFGVVYRGYHLTFEHAIAIKCLKIPTHFVPEAQKLFLDKFKEEGKLLSQLSSAHFGIVRVFDFGVAKSASASFVPYLVLEWLDGMSLEAALTARREGGTGPYAEREAIELLLPAIDAIAAAHEMNVAHRDLKPPNIFVLSQGRSKARMKVLDFGIAKAMQEGETATQVQTRTTSGFTAFSPQYGAPEQFFAKRFGGTGPWTDVYALALCLVEIVSGKTALEGEEPQELFEATTSDTRPTPRARGAVVSDGLELVCEKALARMPKARFPNAGAFRDALMAVLAGEDPSVAARPPGHATEPTHLVGTGAWLAAQGPTANQAPAPAPITEVAMPVVPALASPAKSPTALTVTTAAVPARTSGPPSRLMWVVVPAVVGLGGIALWLAISGAAPPEPAARRPTSATAAPSARADVTTSTTDPPAPELVLTKEVGDGLVIPVGAYKSFSVKVTRNGQPAPKVRVAWTTPKLGPKTFVSISNDQGVASATQLYTSMAPGKFTQIAALVPASWSGAGGMSDNAVPTEGSPVSFDYEQRTEPEQSRPAAAPVGTVGPYFPCRASAECTPGNICVDNHDNIFYCKPVCASDAHCANNKYGATACKPLLSNANPAAIGQKMCQPP